MTYDIMIESMQIKLVIFVEIMQNCGYESQKFWKK